MVCGAVVDRWRYGKVKALRAEGVVAGDQPRLPAGSAAGGWGREPVGKLACGGMLEVHLTCVLLTPAGIFEERHCFLSLLPTLCLLFYKPSSLKYSSCSISFFCWKPNSTHKA